jgi:hypothetical protein
MIIRDALGDIPRTEKAQSNAGHSKKTKTTANHMVPIENSTMPLRLRLAQVFELNSVFERSQFKLGVHKLTVGERDSLICPILNC